MSESAASSNSRLISSITVMLRCILLELPCSEGKKKKTLLQVCRKMNLCDFENLLKIIFPKTSVPAVACLLEHEKMRENIE